MSTFWQSLKSPFLAQAPMDDVTDTVFRQILARCGRPDVFFTEFINTDGLCSVGRDKFSDKLKYTKREHPLVIQIWGRKPEKFFESAKYLAKLGFDGIDINLGCPDRKVMKNKAGAALIREPNLVRELVDAVKRGAPNVGLSLKTRLGIEKILLEEWIGFLLSLPIEALTVHLRTVEELSKAPAHWEETPKITALRKKSRSKVLLIGNGDIRSRQEAVDKCAFYGLDGVMIGRALLSNHWFFNRTSTPVTPDIKRRLELFKEHLNLFEATYGPRADFNRLKKFFKYYLSGYPGASHLRERMMAESNPQGIRILIEEILKRVD